MRGRDREKRTRVRSKTEEDETAQQESRLLKWSVPALTGVSVFLVYLRTLYPSVGGGDSGELVATACATGVAHPPGYPLYTMLAKMFTFLPLGNPAWRVNLLSAICGSAAAVVILLAVRRWTKNSWAGLLAAGLFAFSPLVWRYAVVAEVFSLNHLLLAALLYTAVSYSETRNPKFAYLGALMFGLGMSNHHTCLFYAIPIMVWILLIGRRELWTIRRLMAISGCFIAGFLPHVYLPIADAYKPAVSWGKTSTIQGFLTHLLRREYGTLQLAKPIGDTTGNFLIGLKEYFFSLPHQLFYVGLVLAVVGLYQGLRQKRSRTLVAVTLIGFCFYLITFHALANLPLTDLFYLDIHRRFWPMANLMICVWAGLGFDALISLVPQARSRKLELAIASVAIVAAAAVFNFQVENQHDNTTFSDYGRELFRPLPAGALVWSKGDLGLNAMRYLQQCEGHRRDVRILDRSLSTGRWMNRLINHNYPEVSIPNEFYGPGTNGYDAKEFFDANVSRFKIFITLDSDVFESDRSWESNYSMRPMGSFREIVEKQSSFDPDQYIKHSEEMLPSFDLALLERYPQGSWENVVLGDYWSTRLSRANFLISSAHASGDDRLMLEAAATALEDIINRKPNVDPFVFKRLGQAYNKLVVYDPLYREKMKVAWQKYLQTSPAPDDPNVTEIRKTLNQ